MRTGGCRGRTAVWGLALVLAGYLPWWGTAVWAADTNAPPEEAEVKISGRWFLGNRNLRRTLNVLKEGKRFPATLDANFVEDGALILLSRLRDQGFFKARIAAEVTLEDGSTRLFEFRPDEEVQVDRPLSAQGVHYRIDEGRIYYYRTIQFEGLQSLKPAQARRYFVEMDSLIRLKSTRVYSPNLLERSLGNVHEMLLRQGYKSAAVKAEKAALDHETGAVQLVVRVEEGPLFQVRSVQKEIRQVDPTIPMEVTRTNLQAPFSTFWVQDYARELRAAQFQLGYPDASVDLTMTNVLSLDQKVDLDVVARVAPGPRIKLGEVNYEGNDKTRLSVLHREVTLREGEYLNRVEVERMRNKLARLGAFDTVDFRYERIDDETRDVVYELKESRLLNLHLLMGYGSYELLRGGVELDQYNIFGLAHHSRLRAIQSFKSSRADYYYALPNAIAPDVNLFFNSSYLRRQEVSFVREEVEGGAGVNRSFPEWASDVALRYEYQVLNANNPDVDLAETAQQAQVGAVIFDFKHDRRDNPLLPRHGYKIFLLVEQASPWLGGEVDYQRLDLSGSAHFKVGMGRYLHFGLSHGALFSRNRDESELPFNKRFFPGGENSIRGFQQGEASPLDDQGESVGAETYLLGNLEFEQQLTPSWSMVVFFDGLGIAQHIEHYPFDETLYSVGGGVHWNTLIGPVRVEYGYNLKRRSSDPQGTLHFSIGFPF